MQSQEGGANSNSIQRNFVAPYIRTRRRWPLCLVRLGAEQAFEIDLSGAQIGRTEWLCVRARWRLRLAWRRQLAEVRSGAPTRQRHIRATTPASAPPTVGSSTGVSTTSCTSSRCRSRRPRQVVVLSPSIFGTYVDASMHPPLPYIRPWPVNIECVVRCGHQRRSCPYST